MTLASNLLLCDDLLLRFLQCALSGVAKLFGDGVTVSLSSTSDMLRGGGMVGFCREASRLDAKRDATAS